MIYLHYVYGSEVIVLENYFIQKPQMKYLLRSLTKKNDKQENLYRQQLVNFYPHSNLYHHYSSSLVFINAIVLTFVQLQLLTITDFTF